MSKALKDAVRRGALRGMSSAASFSEKQENIRLLRWLLFFVFIIGTLFILSRCS